MKDKIIMLIVGIVIGVVVAGACFWFATSINKSNDNIEMNGGMPANFNRNEIRQERNFNRNELNPENGEMPANNEV